jgi:uncharacterized protein
MVPRSAVRGTAGASWPRLLGTLLLTVLLIAVAVTAFTLAWPAHPGRAPQRFVAVLLVGSAVGELLALGVLVWLLERRGTTLADLGLGRPTTRVALLLGVLVAGVYAGVTVAGNPVVAQHAVAPTGLKLLAVATTVLVASVVEEVVFRGYVMTTLAVMGHGQAVQVLVSAVAFALVHPTSPVAVGFTFVLGGALALVYLVGNRSLTPVIVAHMLVNLIIEPGLFLSIAESMG